MEGLTKMEDLIVLAELFNMTVLKKWPDMLYSSGNIPNILVCSKSDERPVVLTKCGNSFWASDRLSGVPMRYIGNGNWKYAIEI